MVQVCEKKSSNYFAADMQDANNHYSYTYICIYIYEHMYVSKIYWWTYICGYFIYIYFSKEALVFILQLFFAPIENNFT